MTSRFEAERPFLRGLAYRMLGSVSEAEDIVQDAWLRWQMQRADEIRDPRAWLARIVTHLCLDHLASARMRREQYVGQWLPEPLPDAAPVSVDPLSVLELREDTSCALLQLLERLSPLERAAFLLHDVFDMDFTDIAQTLGRSQASCRQLASRARRRVQQATPRYRVSQTVADGLCGAFTQAIAAGDLDALTRLLADDVQFQSDGGGKVAAVLKPLAGAERVARALLGFARQAPADALRATGACLNGQPALIVRTAAGVLVQTITLAPDANGRIAAIYVQRNPDKLAHLA